MKGNNNNNGAYRQWLLDKLRSLVGDMNILENEVIRSKKDIASLDISKFADLGSDNYEIELDMEILESQGDEIREVVEALRRMETGTFGTCTKCSKKIGKSRLNAIPYAKLCVDCKKAEEENGGSNCT
ncbi:MAG TPA: TraR/DksA family transcriptional regulator [Planctomycetota bacterium]|nr:TraR/DksA family transcriptional regulator [Planctomycetota bacterium]